LASLPDGPAPAVDFAPGRRKAYDRNGVDIRTLAEYLGHSDPGFTVRTYTHLMPSAPDKARRAVDRALGGVVDGSPVVPDLVPGSTETA
jgi:hypothetical protein